MSNELIAIHTTGLTVYAQVINGLGQVYNGATFETPQDANWGDYDISLSEAENTGIYLGDMPVVGAGVYGVVVYEQQGVSPALADPEIAIGEMQWGGTEEVSLSDLESLGSGTITFTYTLTESGSGDPIADAEVAVFTDAAMTNIVVVGYTDAFGQVVFYLDAGTYYFRRRKSGYTFTNPDTEVVS